jgi:hypothetical protein
MNTTPKPATEQAEPDERPPRVTGSPDAIWLNYGDIDRDCTHAECYLSGDVSWCQDNVFDSDVKYVRADLATPPAALVQPNNYSVPIQLADGRTAKIRQCDLRDEDLVVFDSLIALKTLQGVTAPLQAGPSKAVSEAAQQETK